MFRNLMRQPFGTLVAASAACATLLWPGAASAAPPANDAFADAAAIAAMPFSAVVDLAETTTEPGEPSPCIPIDGTAWYRIDSPEARTLRISVAGDHFVHFNVYRQTSAGMAGLSAVSWCVSHGGQSVVPVAEGETLVRAVGPYAVVAGAGGPTRRGRGAAAAQRRLRRSDSCSGAARSPRRSRSLPQRWSLLSLICARGLRRSGPSGTRTRRPPTSR